jgi:hypothetical protein
LPFPSLQQLQQLNKNLVKCGRVKFCEIERNNVNHPEISALAPKAVASLLPSKSRDKYEKTYNIFNSWRTSKNVRNIDEEVMLAFFS